MWTGDADHRVDSRSEKRRASIEIIPGSSANRTHARQQIGVHAPSAVPNQVHTHRPLTMLEAVESIRERLYQPALTRAERRGRRNRNGNYGHDLPELLLEAGTQRGGDAIGEVAEVREPLEAEQTRQQKHDVPAHLRARNPTWVGTRNRGRVRENAASVARLCRRRLLLERTSQLNLRFS